MKLSIKHFDGKTTFAVEIASTEYVDDLKEAIESQHDIPVDQQRLAYKGEEVDDTATMEDLELQDGDELTLEPMKITIILPEGGKRLRLTILPSDTIKKIKKAVAKKTGAKAEVQCAIFSQQERHDGQTLAECNIEHGDAVAIETYTLNVSHWDGEIFQVTPSPRDTVDAIKKIISAKTGVERDAQKYVFKENPVNEFLALKDQQISHRSILELKKPKKAKKEKFKLSVFPEVAPLAVADDAAHLVTVSVRHFNGTTFKVEVSTDEYLEDLKRKIRDQHGIPEEQQRISFDGKEIDETEPFQDQGIDEDSVLKLEPMKILVLLPNGKKIRFSVNIEDSIKRVKRVVTKKGGIPSDIQIVKYKDIEVADGKSLASLFVGHGDTLVVETFQITVLDWEGEAVDFTDISPKDTVQEIKAFMKKEKDYPLDKQTFMFEQQKLNEFIGIGDQGVKHKGVIEMELPKTEPRTREKFKLQMIGTIELDPLKRSTHGDDDICVTIQKSKTESFPIYFDSTGYVEDLKLKIERKHDIKVDDQRLTLDGNILENDLTLLECNIVDGSTIVLEPMKVFVLLPNGKKMRLTVSTDDPIKKLKKAVFKRAKISVDVQCMMFGGKELMDMNSIGDSGISHEDELTVEKYAINIAHWLGDIFVLTDVSPGDNVEDLKSILLKRKQIPKEMQQFTFEGQPVNAFIGLRDQGIGHKSTLMMEDLEIIKSPRPKRATISEVKDVDTSDEESVSSSGSEASWLKRCALDEEFTSNLVKIDTSNPEASWLANVAAKEEKKGQSLYAPNLDADDAE